MPIPRPYLLQKVFIRLFSFAGFTAIAGSAPGNLRLGRSSYLSLEYKVVSFFSRPGKQDPSLRKPSLLRASAFVKSSIRYSNIAPSAIWVPFKKKLLYYVSTVYH